MSGYTRAQKAAKDFFAAKERQLSNALGKDDQREILYGLILEAIRLYAESTVWSDKRKIDLEVINHIFKTTVTDGPRTTAYLYPTAQDCINELHRYFSRESNAGEYLGNNSEHKFTTGLRDKSTLEDSIAAVLNSFNTYVTLPQEMLQKWSEHVKNSVHHAVERAWLTYENAERKANRKPNRDELLNPLVNELDKINFENDLPTETLEECNKVIHKHIEGKKIKHGSFEFYLKNELALLEKKQIHFHEFHKEAKLTYTLSDFLEYAVDKYIAENKHVNSADIETISKLIDDYRKSDQADDTREKLAIELAKYKDLESYFRDAINSYNKHAQNDERSFERTFKTKEWKMQEKPKKIIIALHGWRDSVDTWNELGQAAIADDPDTLVIAYDQRGFGFDADRHKNKFDIDSDMLRLDLRLFIKKVMDDNPNAEISLVGHSMGASIIALENEFIKKQTKIKSTSYISPAVTPSLMGYFKLNKMITKREAHDEVLQKQQSNPRFETTKTTALALLQIMVKAFKVFTKLFSSIKHEQKQEVEANADPAKSHNYYVYMGEKDKAVDQGDVLRMASSKNNLQVFKYERGDHLLLAGRNAKPVLKKVIENIKNNFSKSINEQNYKI